MTLSSFTSASFRRTLGLWLLIGLFAIPSLAGQVELLTRTNRPALVIETNGPVKYLPNYLNPPVVPEPARLNQEITFDQALVTLINGRAAVRFHDWSAFRLADRSSLVIVRDSKNTNAPAIRLLDGQMYFSSRGGPIKIPVETPAVRGLTKGTEFLVRVDAQSGRTEFTMFDGEVELTNEFGNVRVTKGQQGLAETGQSPRRLPKIEATNLVQWWIYYPGVLDPEETGLNGAEQADLAASLEAYRAGALPEALRLYPTPPEPSSEAARIYYAALLLSVGAVDRAEAQLQMVNPDAPQVRALHTLLNAVAPPLILEGPAEAAKLPAATELPTPASSSEWLARSYAHQATNNLKAALETARAAITLSPGFAFGWARVGELEFSFGDIHAAKKAIDRALTLGPRNAQAHALNGFLLAAENRFSDAIASFELAIKHDPALANGWLGRGLCRIRRGDTGDGRHDLQTAAILEPRRSLLRSYVGKAFADAGLTREASKEFGVAKHFDPNDPTPWLYSALLDHQLNRINEAVQGLERSIELNDNRALYRSRLLLDEDRAVRSSSLARIYQDAGLNEVARREASRAVSDDYANYSSHQFLSESYNALRDPTRFDLRYETPWFNEWLLASLLSPVGGTPLSQHVSQQEYARLFERDRIGLISDSSCRSDGQYRQIASQFGVLGNTAWSLDLDYQHNNGVRPNNELDRIEWHSTLKYQLTPNDSALLLAKYQDYHSGDNFQYYDPKSALRHFSYDENQSPIIVGAWHHEWSPHIHTLLLGGRLENDQHVTGSGISRPVVHLANGDFASFSLNSFDLNYQSELEVYTAELNQVFQSELHTLVLGGRVQSGEFQSQSRVYNPAFANPAADTRATENFFRGSAYGYYTVELPTHLRLTAGVAYDAITFPENFRAPPITAGEDSRHQLSPKAALVWAPVDPLTVRAIYTRSLGGASFDESYRLEPTQLAGFPQSFRTIISESVVGSVAAPEFETAGAAMDFKLPAATYAGVQFERLASQVRQTIGTLEYDTLGGSSSVGSTRQHFDYEETRLSIHVGKLLGHEWSIGAQYRFTSSELQQRLPEIPAVQPDARVLDHAELHNVTSFLLFNHASGFFSRVESQWYWQDWSHTTAGNTGLKTTSSFGDSFFQVNLLAGFRFPRQRGEVSAGVLNLNGADYQLFPLTPYSELPRERVLVARLRLNF